MRGAKRVVAAALLAAGGAASAQEYVQVERTGVRAHEGVFLQLDLGLGFVESFVDEGGLDVEVDGPAGEFSVAVGYNVAPGFIVGGQLWGVSAADPDVSVRRGTFGTDDVTLSLSGIGVNLTYYLIPQNIYLQATPSFTTLTIEEDDVEVDTDVGFGMRFAVGKEWWVSDSWALGLNAQFAFSSNDLDRGGGGSFDSRWYGVAFSATYD
jgi:hypothetical protein